MKSFTGIHRLIKENKLFSLCESISKLNDQDDSSIPEKVESQEYIDEDTYACVEEKVRLMKIYFNKKYKNSIYFRLNKTSGEVYTFLLLIKEGRQKKKRLFCFVSQHSYSPTKKRDFGQSQNLVIILTIKVNNSP